MSAQLDLIIRGGFVVDGTGLPRRRIDVGVKDGRVACLGRLDDREAAQEIDAEGLVVAPGIVDAHTHYDLQISYDPYATTSCFHGVTTVLAGNCGFSMAPCKPEDREFLGRVFAGVEDMDPEAMSILPWDDCVTFSDYLASRQGRLGVNLTCYVGHTNLRRWVMGPEASQRVATEAEVAEMCRLATEAMAAGAAGFSSSASPTHLDLDGNAIPSRWADRSEVLAIAEAVGRHGAGSIGFLPESVVHGVDEVDRDFLIQMGLVSGLPVIIQGLGGRSKVAAPDDAADTKRYLDRTAREGAPVYSLLIVRPFDRTMAIGPSNVYYPSVPAWDAMLRLDHDARVAALRDPAQRQVLRTAVENHNQDPAKGSTTRPPGWDVIYVDQVFKPENEHLQGRSLAELAASTGQAPADVMLDLALAEDLETIFRWRTENPEWTSIVQEMQTHPGMLLGTSDGGAHLARDDGADWTSYFLRTWVMDRQVWTLEEGIRQITHVPATVLGLAGRGLVRVGGWADLMIFDPDEIGPLRKEFVRDLPGGGGRFKAWGTGVKATIVNGQPIVVDGKLTTSLPGQVLRPT